MERFPPASACARSRSPSRRGGADVPIDDTNIYRQCWKDKDDIEHLIWTIVFEGVKIVGQGKDYKLTVANAEDSGDKAEVPLDVVAPDRVIMIQSPQSGATISSSGFAPHGTTDTLLPLSAVVTVPGASSVNGTLVQGPPNTMNWVFQFSQLPTGTGSLTVYSSSSSQTVTGLTIS